MMKWTIIVIFVTSVSARAGHESHGGDMAVALFYHFARKVQTCLPEAQEVKANPEILRSYKDMLTRVKVYSQDSTILDGEEVDAINYPDIHAPKIYLNRKRWLVNGTADSLRSVLVLHEMMMLLGFEDSTYTYSYPWILEMEICLEGGKK